MTQDKKKPTVPPESMDGLDDQFEKVRLAVKNRRENLENLDFSGVVSNSQQTVKRFIQEPGE